MTGCGPGAAGANTLRYRQSSPDSTFSVMPLIIAIRGSRDWAATGPKWVASRTPDLEALVRGMYVRGLSTQDVGALYGEAFGETRLSKSTVSRITQQLNQDFDTWRRRDLSELPVVYLFLDGQYHAL